MIDIATLRVGDKVHYQPEHYGKDRWENGMIKEVPDFVTDETTPTGYNSVRVVYNCAGDWKNFKDYTSALTNINQLELGWKH